MEKLKIVGLGVPIAALLLYAAGFLWYFYSDKIGITDYVVKGGAVFLGVLLLCGAIVYIFDRDGGEV